MEAYRRLMSLGHELQPRGRELWPFKRQGDKWAARIHLRMNELRQAQMELTAAAHEHLSELKKQRSFRQEPEGFQEPEG
ncbi:MAG: hypothetical protein ACRYF3_08940 [Janthinobacterium lividum]